jgi:hypothetical protein
MNPTEPITFEVDESVKESPSASRENELSKKKPE